MSTLRNMGPWIRTFFVVFVWVIIFLLSAIAYASLKSLKSLKSLIVIQQPMPIYTQIEAASINNERHNLDIYHVATHHTPTPHWLVSKSHKMCFRFRKSDHECTCMELTLLLSTFPRFIPAFPPHHTPRQHARNGRGEGIYKTSYVLPQTQPRTICV